MDRPVTDRELAAIHERLAAIEAALVEIRGLLEYLGRLVGTRPALREHRRTGRR